VLEGKVESMSWHAHKTTSQRKIITVQEWADFTGVSKNTILAWMKKYKVAYPKVAYDPHDIYSVLNFFTFLQSRL
jgi:hypothetical protein